MKQDFKISFEKIIKTSHEYVNGIELIPILNMANLTLEHGTMVNVNEFHQSMGHVHGDSLCKMAEYYGLKLHGQFNMCFECSVAKICQHMLEKPLKR
jgi:hypothetical protein